MIILAIDTSCDETSVGISNNDNIIANVLSSQIQSHQEWGGVVPSLARRKHQELIDLVINRALKQAKLNFDEIDAFAVTTGPGLAVALEVGIQKAKELAIQYNKPLIPVNHMEGHLYSSLSKNSNSLPKIEYQFPLLTLLISGGHTEIILMSNHGKYKIIGETLDDAIGESFDKVGRMLNFGYPAGPVLEKIAKKGDENAYELPIPMQYSKDLNMSYSGLKTASMKLINSEIGAINEYGEKFESQLQESTSAIRSNKIPLKTSKTTTQKIADISASFQKYAVEQILLKTQKAIMNLKNENIEIFDLIIAGGVAQNLYLRKKFKKTFQNLRIHYPKSKKLYTDNAGMIAVAGYYNFLRNNYINKTEEINSIDRNPNWRIDEVD